MIRPERIILTAGDHDKLETVCETVMSFYRKFKCRVEVNYRGKRIVKEPGDGLRTATALRSVFLQLEIEFLSGE